MRNDAKIKNSDMKQKKYQKNFGFLFSFVFIFLALYPLYFNLPIRSWALLFSTFFFISALFFPYVLKYPSLIWLRLGNLLHKIFSPLILFFVYFLSIVITGLIMKIFRRDPLNRKADDKIETYWVRKKIINNDDSNLKDQY